MTSVAIGDMLELQSGKAWERVQVTAIDEADVTLLHSETNEDDEGDGQPTTFSETVSLADPTIRWRRAQDQTKFVSTDDTPQQTTDAKTDQANETTTAEVAEWYYLGKTPDDKHGPVTHSQLLAQCSDETLVWKQGLPQWDKLAVIRGKQAHQMTAEAAQELGEGQFFYLDSSRTQQGPIGKWDLIQLAMQQEVFPDTLVWKHGDKQWQSISKLPEFDGHVSEQRPAQEATTTGSESDNPATECKWFYLDNYGRRQGPESVQGLRALWQAAALHKTNLGWSEGLTEWTALEKIDALSAVFADAHDDIDAAEAQKIDAVSEEKLAEQKEAKKRKRKNKPKKRKWKQVNHTAVYVTGLPSDITMEDMVAFFKKAGIIKTDASGQPKIKIYRNAETGEPKGDGLVTFLKEESLGLAHDLLHEAHIKPGCPVQVQQAEFKQKGDEFIAPKQHKVDAKTAAARAVLQKETDQRFALSWDDDAEERFVEHKGLKIVILQHMFRPEEALQHANGGITRFYQDLEEDIGAECTRAAGPIEKLTLFRGSPIGAVAIKFKSGLVAKKCIEVMDGRFFAGQKIVAEYFDGVTDYRVKESDEDETRRVDQFGAWLDAGAEKS